MIARIAKTVLLVQLGILAVDFSFAGDTADAVLANMRRFREDVLAKV